jgi:5'-methylthioadenosine phosphorylase
MLLLGYQRRPILGPIIPKENGIMAVIGIIGGSGLDDPDILGSPSDREMKTPYGDTSSPLKQGMIGETGVILLARHGRQHTIPPSQVNNRANLWALRESGATHIIATSAVGSLREEIRPGDLVILDQFIDFTRHRPLTFFEAFAPGEMKHTPMADPFSSRLRKAIISACTDLDLPFHERATVVTIEGPRFSTRAESHMFRAWGADVINMSIAPECALANELGIPYASIAMSTDYDCWKQDEEPVTWEAVLRTFKENVSKVTGLLLELIPRVEKL